MSNDNPYSEAHFKTMKYSSDFPPRFGSLSDAGAFCEGFFAHYNHEHRHSELEDVPLAVELRDGGPGVMLRQAGA